MTENPAGFWDLQDWIEQRRSRGGSGLQNGLKKTREHFVEEEKSFKFPTECR